MSTNYPGSRDSYSTKQSGDTISESHINDPQDAIEAIETKLGITTEPATTIGIDDADGDTKIQVGETADEDIIRFDLGNATLVSAAEVLTIQAIDSLAVKFEPTTDNMVDLGSSTKEFRNLYIDGIAYIDSIVNLKVDDDGLNNTVAEIDNDGTNHALYIHQDGVLASAKYGLYVYTNIAQVNSPLVAFHNTGAGSQSIVTISNMAGTGIGLHIDHRTIKPALNLYCPSNGAHLKFTGDPTVASPADGEFWFDGSNLKLRVGPTTYNISMTATI